jgi:hypothetical protein
LKSRPAVVLAHRSPHSARSSPEHANACELARSIIARLPHQISQQTTLLLVAQWQRRREWRQPSEPVSVDAWQRSLGFQAAQRRVLQRMTADERLRWK